MADGVPQWQAFHDIVGALLGGLCARYPGVRAYGEMVDLLWQQGRRDAALRLEGYWNELGKEHALSLFCAYRMDALDSDAYVGPLDSVCNAHSHFLPARHQDRFDEAVHAATFKVLDQRLAQMLLALGQVTARERACLSARRRFPGCSTTCRALPRKFSGNCGPDLLQQPEELGGRAAVRKPAGRHISMLRREIVKYLALAESEKVGA
jgi:MEDS: MEthanogen/methylotroph, DcmR Sensory domain